MQVRNPVDLPWFKLRKLQRSSMLYLPKSPHPTWRFPDIGVKSSILMGFSIVSNPSGGSPIVGNHYAHKAEPPRMCIRAAWEIVGWWPRWAVCPTIRGSWRVSSKIGTSRRTHDVLGRFYGPAKMCPKCDWRSIIFRSSCWFVKWCFGIDVLSCLPPLIIMYHNVSFPQNFWCHQDGKYEVYLFDLEKDESFISRSGASTAIRTSPSCNGSPQS